MQLYLILAIIIALLSAVFAIQNATPVTANFYGFIAESSRAVDLLIAFAAGAATNLLIGVPQSISGRQAIAENPKTRRSSKRLRERTTRTFGGGRPARHQRSHARPSPVTRGHQQDHGRSRRPKSVPECPVLLGQMGSGGRLHRVRPRRRQAGSRSGLKSLRPVRIRFHRLRFLSGGSNFPPGRRSVLLRDRGIRREEADLRTNQFRNGSQRNRPDDRPAVPDLRPRQQARLSPESRPGRQPDCPNSRRGTPRASGRRPPSAAIGSTASTSWRRPASSSPTRQSMTGCAST